MNATVIGVLGASGGVGTSTVAAYLAWRARPTGVVLVDGDPAKGAADVVAAVEHLPGMRWGDFGGLRGRADGAAIVRALPATSRYAVLAGGGAPVGLAQVEAVLDGLRGSASVLVADLGCPLPSAATLLPSCAALLLVTGLGVSHLADLERVAEDLPGLLDHCRLLTRGPRRRAGLTAAVAGHVGLTALGHWADDPRVPSDLEHGRPPGESSRGLRDLADRFLDLALPPLQASA